jgi:hypothetical protein
VIAETRYPGRTVTVDGKPTETFAANGVQIGLPLETGSHDIRLRYTPRYRPLVWLALVGWVAVAALGVWEGTPRAWRPRLRVRAWWPRRRHQVHKG